MTDADLVKGRCVLVTGAAGRIGSALTHKLVALSPDRLVCLTRSPGEAVIFAPEKRVEVVTGEVTDPEVVRRAMRDVDIVFHLAAETRHDRCEEQPSVAVSTNVVGTQLVLRQALSTPSVRRVIVASSVQAAEPTSVYGMTKALVERLVIEAGRSCMAVRLGTVAGSRGVVEAWRRTSRERAEIDVTDPEMTRFAMSESEAVDLLLDAVDHSAGGGVLIRPMRAYRLGDLAAVFSDRTGARIRVVGRRRGEKTHEYLLSPDEARDAFVLGRDLVLGRRERSASLAPISSRDAHRLSPQELAPLFGLPSPAGI